MRPAALAYLFARIARLDDDDTLAELRELLSPALEDSAEHVFVALEYGALERLEVGAVVTAETVADIAECATHAGRVADVIAEARELLKASA